MKRKKTLEAFHLGQEGVFLTGVLPTWIQQFLSRLM